MLKDLYSEGDAKEKQIATALMLVVDCGIRWTSIKIEMIHLELQH